jgi:hypothetical protein
MAGRGVVLRDDAMNFDVERADVEAASSPLEVRGGDFAFAAVRSCGGLLCALAVATALLGRFVPGAWAAEADPYVAFEAAKKAFEAGLVASREEHERRLVALGVDYKQDLLKLAVTYQEHGAIPGLVAMHDELKRVAAVKDWTAIAVSPAAVPDLRVLQETYLARIGNARVQGAEAVLGVYRDYLMELAALRARMVDAQDSYGEDLLTEERGRVLDLPALREALKDLEQAGKVAAGGKTDAFLTSGDSASEDAKKMDLYKGEGEAAEVTMGYTVDLYLAVKTDRLKSRKTDASRGTTEAEDGFVDYIPEIVVMARNKPLDPGCTLALEYFSRPISDTERQRDCVEHIRLPAVPLGQSCTVRGRGVAHYRSSQVVKSIKGPTIRSEQGRELSGMVLSIFGPDDVLLLQRVSSRSLLRESSQTKLPESPCPR